MTIDEYFEWLAKYCITNHYGLSASMVCSIAEGKDVELGHITQVGRKHLLPRGWTRHITSDGSLYLPPEAKKKEEKQ